MALLLKPIEPPLPGARQRAPKRRRWDLWRVVEAVASVALGAVLLVWGLPLVSGAAWAEVADVLGDLGAPQVLALTVVWQLGLWVHTIALSAAMPGLSKRRAWFLNQTGSAVSNIVPFGGAAGTALNYSTCRVWGFSTSAFLRWALVTNIWDTLTKLAVPAVAVAWLVLGGTTSSEELASAAVGCLVVLGVLLGFTWFMLHRDEGARVVGRFLDWVVARLRLRRFAGRGYGERAVGFRRDSESLVAHAWGRLTFGKAAYAMLQAFLLWLCLTWLGGEASMAVVFAAFAAERVLSMAVVTPGATGVVEVGMTGMLVAFGVEPATAAASVLLYRAFIVGLEIPTGGAALLWWLISRRHTRRLRDNPESARPVRGSM